MSKKRERDKSTLYICLLLLDLQICVLLILYHQHQSHITLHFGCLYDSWKSSVSNDSP